MDAILDMNRSSPPGKDSLEYDIMIVSVYDNYLSDPEFKADWGFSTIVITHEDVILFDTGEDPEILLFNMDKLGIKPESVHERPQIPQRK